MFSVVPKEPRNIYSKLNTAKNRRNALSFYRKYQDFFIAAEKTYNVPQSVILSIAQIESRCGVYTGKHPVFYRLARIAQAAAPDNLDENFRLKRLIDKKLTFKQVSDRGKWLEKTFLPHLAATLPIAQKMGIHPLELKGSLAGAIGIPQFLPGNVIEYGVDANQNGVVSLHEPEDAILSLAKFLHMHGWKTEKSIPKNRNIIQHYNNSDPYIDNVVAMAQALKAHTATLD
jgi:membrane-bound lytic murein transglycosylase B